MSLLLLSLCPLHMKPVDLIDDGTPIANPALAASACSAGRLRSRDLCEPRLRAGMRVRYDSGKWDCCANAVRHDPSWASQPWAMTQMGVTVEPIEFPGSIFPTNGPWGLPDFATPVRWDGFDSVTWVRTSCLDVIDDDRVIQTGQQLLVFEAPNAPASATGEKNQRNNHE